jgi:hypothetical protein
VAQFLFDPPPAFQRQQGDLTRAARAGASLEAETGHERRLLGSIHDAAMGAFDPQGFDASRGHAGLGKRDGER